MSQLNNSTPSAEGQSRSLSRKTGEDRVKRHWDVTEAQLEAKGWSGAEGVAPLEAVEADIRLLMERLAKTVLETDEARRQILDEQRRCLLDLAELGDALERYFRAIEKRRDEVTPQMEKWLRNFRTVQTLVNRMLADRGATRMETSGQLFDARWHKCTAKVCDMARAEQSIVDEDRAGYLWRGQVVRKAEVVVAVHEPVSE